MYTFMWGCVILATEAPGGQTRASSQNHIIQQAFFHQRAIRGREMAKRVPVFVAAILAYL